MDYRAEMQILKDDLAVCVHPKIRALIAAEMIEIKREKEWNEQDHQCSGSGYSHKPHGKCRGYSTDRT